MSAMAQKTSLTIVYSTVIQAQIKENIKAPRHWPLCGEFTGTGHHDTWRNMVYFKCENESKTNLHKLTLQAFSCMMNPVKYVHPAAFRGLLVLERVKLRHTQLHQLPPGQHIGHSLTSLEISFSVHFTGNDAHNFTYLRKIKYFEMHHNGLIRTPLGLDVIAGTIIVLNFAYNTIISLTSMESVEFIKLQKLRLKCNNITHLHPEFLIAPRLRLINLEGNHLVSLAEVTQHSWGGSLPEHKYRETCL